jgi:L-2-hydroxyglutarate oxidase LhgO
MNNMRRRFMSLTPAPDVEVVVIGAGVIGLAVARTISAAGHEVLVLDPGPKAGTQTSSRSSEVIHAGIYYPPGSLKARHCVTGKQLMFEFCEAYAVPHSRVGKLIVACSEAQQQRLCEIAANAASNGVHDLQLLTAKEVRELEPEVQCTAALLSPSTGIVDSHRSGGVCVRSICMRMCMLVWVWFTHTNAHP